METTTTKKAAKKDFRKLILEGFVNHVLEHGSMPKSVFKFAKDLKMKEEEFYTYFTSFESIKSAIWVSIFESTLEQIESQEVFKEYSVREKFLSFLFTWIEELKKNRSYLLSLYQDKAQSMKSLPLDAKEFKEKFKDFAGEIILEGKETQEIANRPIISDKYDEALWLQVAFIFRFWLDDRSPRFEKTDAAIEKSVNLTFDLMGKSALDSFLDFAKFLYQNK
ncbi:DNA-binding transcriptional regulator, AcrR family [Algoriphagus alkaliphilus]|uniref:DNA-binding transcriptional regulator, AcrR family n=1 Tax=Algoriphagus alkaliphilus TaxID=279824 RepID=A0A1G5XHU7_9BACT|nr:TetR family transcriptional regulator C-terminal domain-containing protein [Algoriphagus alkaliphilus]MBA4302268.1 TetR/AcrR family transcriptional regulator [Cyclobacterium sp.]SDA69902.1 DNA-binding transcriptional regulator, AcrR family [Algoriphagus alkaliphilus]